MRVLVTGGAGFIGSHVVDALVGDGHEVVVVDRTDAAYPNRTATYHRADIRDTSIWPAILNGVDAVSHQAARVGLGVRFADITGYVEDNDVGTAVLLGALDDVGFRGRLVLGASMVAYGEGAYRCARCGPVRAGPRSAERLSVGLFDPPCPVCGASLAPEPVDEDAAVDPRNVYAATKVHQEHLFASFARQTGCPVIALRYHNVYGPRSPVGTPYAGVASLFLDALRRGEAPQVFEDGGQLRDFVHVRDVARANLAALFAPSNVTGPFNVSSGRPRSVLQMAMGLWQMLGATAPAPQVTGAWRAADVRHVIGSPERARTLLGFEASIDFDEGLAEIGGGPCTREAQRVPG